MSSSLDELIQAGHDMYVSFASTSWIYSLTQLRSVPPSRYTVSELVSEPWPCSDPDS